MNWDNLYAKTHELTFMAINHTGISMRFTIYEASEIFLWLEA